MQFIKYSALLAALLGASLANAATVNGSFISKSASEIRGQLGGYAQPTIYLNQYACGERQLSAMACGPYTISVGSQFLQSQENQHGNYAAKMVLAHEWGHSIQFTRNIRKSAPYQELQADCTGGSFIKYAQTRLGYASFLEAAVSSARAAADWAEHGTPSQRDYFTRWGYANGVTKCLSALPR
ncbi:hypothetical protein V8J88_04290 [Massilia sp. W12]|uniref:hypothetical protein n=1 Tax=Massilia sp. W12 TaxID=3126507 RepID=UPI0030CF9B89